MDDRKLRKLVRDSMRAPKLTVGPDVLSELRDAPMALFENLPEHEKSIAITAFVAAAGATQYVNDNITSPEQGFQVFVEPTLGEDRTRAGLMAAAAALSRIPQTQRSVSLTSLLDKCNCNPIPVTD